MSSNARPADDGGTFLEAFAAEVTGAAYAIALRHAIGGSWLDLELGLWKALADTVEHWARPAPRPGSPDGFDVWRERFLVELTGEAFHVQQAAQIRAYRAAWKEAGHTHEPRVSVSRSIFALVDDRDRAYFGHGRAEEDQIGFIDEKTRAIFGRSYAAEPDTLIEQLKADEAIAEADTLLLTVPNQLGVAYNAHVIEAILTHVAPALGWR